MPNANDILRGLRTEHAAYKQAGNDERAGLVADQIKHYENLADAADVTDEDVAAEPEAGDVETAVADDTETPEKPVKKTASKKSTAT